MWALSTGSCGNWISLERKVVCCRPVNYCSSASVKWSLNFIDTTGACMTSIGLRDNAPLVHGWWELHGNVVSRLSDGVTSINFICFCRVCGVYDAAAYEPYYANDAMACLCHIIMLSHVAVACLHLYQNSVVASFINQFWVVCNIVSWRVSSDAVSRCWQII